MSAAAVSDRELAEVLAIIKQLTEQATALGERISRLEAELDRREGKAAAS